MTLHIWVQPGETISQALTRALIDGTVPITLPPGIYIEGPELRKTYIVDRRKTGIPFL